MAAVRIGGREGVGKPDRDVLVDFGAEKEWGGGKGR